MTNGKPSPPSLEAQIITVAKTVFDLTNEVNTAANKKDHNDETGKQLLLRLDAILAALKQWYWAYTAEKKRLEAKLKKLREQEDQEAVAAETQTELDELDKLKRLAGAAEAKANDFVGQLGGNVKPPAAARRNESIPSVDDLLEKLKPVRKPG